MKFKGKIHGANREDERESAGEMVVHSQGFITLAAVADPPLLDLAELKGRIQEIGPDPDACYAGYAAMGIVYGPGHRAIEAIRVGDGEVLAKLVLPPSVVDTGKGFVLHPSLMDGALQAAMGLAHGQAHADGATGMETLEKPSLPFALEEVEIYGRCMDVMWAWIRSGRESKIDIDLCDGQGSVAVRMKGISSRPLHGEEAYPVGSHHHAHGKSPDEKGEKSSLPGRLTLMHPVWNAVYFPGTRVVFPEPAVRVVIAGGSPSRQKQIKRVYPEALFLEVDPRDSVEGLTKKLKQKGPVDHMVWIAPDSPIAFVSDPALVREQNGGLLQLFRMVKALLALGYGVREPAWTLITTRTVAVGGKEPVNPLHAGIQGFAGSLAAEYPQWKIRLLDLEPDGQWPVKEMFSLPFDARGEGLALRQGEWFRQSLVPLRDARGGESLYRKNGVYVVIGGAGGIGEVWTRYMIENYGARIAWIGRRKREGRVQEKLDALEKTGLAPLYVRADAEDQKALQGACDRIFRQFGEIHGVVHSAIVLQDQSLSRMDEEQFKAALSAKVNVSVCMAGVFCRKPLDFALFFSSMISFEKSPGQSNYAAGCTFKDAFARRLAREWDCPVKIMNWGYWGSVGIVKGREQVMARFGMGSIEPREGMEALETLMRSSLDQMALVKRTGPAREAERPEEWMSVLGESIPSCIGDLPQALPEDARQKEALQSLEDPRNAEMEDLLLRLLLCALKKAGVLGQEYRSARGSLDESAGKPDIFSNAVVSEPGSEYRSARGGEKWCEQSIALLTAKGLLHMGGESVPADMAEDPGALWKKWEQAKQACRKDERPQLDLVEACLRALPEILTGKKRATDILFPDASMSMVEGIYKGNRVADLFNAYLTGMVTAYVKQRLSLDPSARIRILEIGAGTGGTTAPLLDALEPFQKHVAEYCYTDLSKAFLLHAQAHYAPRFPSLSTRIFDVEKPLGDQGIRVGHYDLVIAANVLHATLSIRETLWNAKGALRKNGLMVLNELSFGSLPGHLTFGLLEGWWRYTDPALRIPGCPGLSPETWTRVLLEEGFGTILFPAASARPLGQQIIVADSDGIVRQRTLVAAPSERGTDPAPDSAPDSAPGPNLATQEEDGCHNALCQRTIPEKISPETLHEKTTAYLRRRLAATLKMPAHEIDPSRPMEAYGMDSILAVHLTNTLHRHFEKISSTLFFEVQTIDALADYLIANRKEALLKQLGLEEGGTEEGGADEGAGSRPDKGDPNAMLRFKPGFGKAGMKPCLPSHSQREEETHGRIYRVQDVAVIGLSGRYPLAGDLDAFWDNLRTGKNCIIEVPPDRWDWKPYFEEKRGKRGRSHTRWGGFIGDVDKFDALFFRISPRDAERMDPQERLFLETAHAGIEDAGYTPETLCPDGKVGVFVGVMNSMYTHRPGYWSIANRVSYALNFQGPSLAVDTACSSSLTAIHLALESLYCGSSRCAVAGGVNLILDPRHFLLLSEMNMVSPGDRCCSFGAHADGFVDSEGVGAVVLKPLDRAVADRDHIYGVIKASMINAGGKTNGYTVPNPNAQFQLIADTLERARVPAEAVSYVEAHGTATVLGDPIEIAGLTRAFGKASGKDAEGGRRDNAFSGSRPYCAIGSVKSNIGHGESAAGIAGLTKVLLQMKHGMLVPTINCEALNPNIDFQNTPFVVQKEVGEWKRPLVRVKGREERYPRIAGISSFGAGGANAHLIVAEYLPDRGDTSGWAGGQNPLPSTGESFPIVLSARTGDRLNRVAANLLQTLKGEKSGFSPDEIHMADLAYTLQVGRVAMEERLGLMAGSREDLMEKLEGFLKGNGSEALYRGNAGHTRAALSVFTGDRDMAGVVRGWMETKNYARLLELWVKGFDVDWNGLYTSLKPCRISLPTYPFERERHWISLTERLGQPVELLSQETEGPREWENSSEEGEWDGLTYLPGWEELQVSSAEKGDQGFRNLLLFSCGGFSEFENTVLEDFRKKNPRTRVIEIRSAEETRQLEEDRWHCGVADVHGFENCLKEYPEIDGVLFFSLDRARPDLTDPGALARTLQCNEIQLLRLFKFLRRRREGNTDLYILTLDNHGTAGGEFHAAGGGLTGLAFSIAQGDHRFRVRNIDLSSEDLARAEDREVAAGMISHEPPSHRGEVIKYRAGCRYRQVFFKAARNVQGSPGFRTAGVYVIVGGSGTLGRVVTHYLIKEYRARVVWIGRTSASSPEIEEKIASYREAGEPPAYVQADVTRPGALKAAVGKIRQTHGRIHGAVFSAIVFNHENSPARTTEEEFQRILDVKIKGSINFYTAFQEESLDFICYFSSGQAFSFSGAANLSAYAAGITFADTFVQSVQKRAGFPMGTINWGFWKPSLDGMDAGEKVGALSNSEGFRCFEGFVRDLQDGHAHRLLCMKASKPVQAMMNIGRGTVLISDPGADVPKRVLEGQDRREKENSRQDAARGRAADARHQGGSNITENLWPHPGEEKRENLRQQVYRTVVRSLSRSLKIAEPSIDPDTAFSDYGMDSVGAAGFMEMIGKALGISLNSALVFDYANVNRLTDHVVADRAGEIGTGKGRSVAQRRKRHAGHKAADRGEDKDKARGPESRSARGSLSERVSNPDMLSSVVAGVPGTESLSVGSGHMEEYPAGSGKESAANTLSPAIAVIGMSGQFPGAEDLHTFWQNLIGNVDGVGALPWAYPDREETATTGAATRTGGALRGGVLKRRDCFDPLFFKISPREARAMNPHQRLILQESWKGLEDAGYDPGSLSGRPVGMFIGAEPTGYYQGSFTGASDAVIASRLSYYLDLTGPAMVVNTGCASSATAIHLACESLRSGESALAIAGGVFAGINPEMLDRLSEIEMASRSGQCRTFDASADGTAFSEGVGVVVLKRLEDAVFDGDTIYGLIEASGVNQDGAGNGLTAPNGRAQEALITGLYRRYGIDPEKIGYVEAHGTGTRLGDPVEGNALVRAFAHFTEKKNYCAVGSAKAHIGHTSASAGVIGLIKVLLSMKHGTIPGLLHFKQLNPLIAFKDSPFYVNKAPVPWPTTKGRPLKAALNSFGHSGTNVHLVISAYLKPDEEDGSVAGPEARAVSGEDSPCIILLSAKNGERLKAQARRLLEFLQRHHPTAEQEKQDPMGEGLMVEGLMGEGEGLQAQKEKKPLSINLQDLAYTLQTGRRAMEERVGFVVETLEALEDTLARFLGEEDDPEVLDGGGMEIKIHQGRVKQNSEAMAVLTADEDMDAAVCAWMEKGKYEKLLTLWVKGVAVDWHRLYKNRPRPCRMHLPPYPFADEPYGAGAIAVLREEFGPCSTGGGPLSSAEGRSLPVTEGCSLPSTEGRPLPSTEGRSLPSTEGGPLSSTEGRPLPEAEPVPPNQGVGRAPGEGEILPKEEEEGKDRESPPARDTGLPAEAWDGLSYLPRWEVLPLPGKAEAGHRVVVTVFSGESAEFEEALCKACLERHKGVRIIGIRLGDQTVRESKDRWCCGVEDPEGFERCLTDLDFIDAVYFISVHWQGQGPAGALDPLYSPLKNEIQLLRLVSVLGRKILGDAIVDCYILTRDTRNFCDIRNGRNGRNSHNIRSSRNSHDNHNNHNGHDGREMAAPSGNVHGAGLSGLAYALAQADHRFQVRNIDLSGADLLHRNGVAQTLHMIFREPPSQRGEGVKFRAGMRYHQVFLKMEWNAFQGLSGLKKGGVYVILGGSGSVGKVMTRYLIQNYQAKVVWLGRTPASSPVIEEKIAGFRKWGPPPFYIQADVTDYPAMEKAVERIQKDHPVINGAIFAGLVFERECPLDRLTEAEFRQTLDVKTKGSINFFKAFENQDLDFMCFFSSIQAFPFLSAKDSAAYAAGITFSDGFVRSLESGHHFPVSGHRFPVGIINWGFWADTTLGTGLEKRLAPYFGLIPDHDGFRFFERFTRALQDKVVDQVLCVRAWERLAPLMNGNGRELVSLGRQAHESLIHSLWGDNEAQQ